MAASHRFYIRVPIGPLGDESVSVEYVRSTKSKYSKTITLKGSRSTICNHILDIIASLGPVLKVHAQHSPGVRGYKRPAPDAPSFASTTEKLIWKHLRAK